MRLYLVNGTIYEQKSYCDHIETSKVVGVFSTLLIAQEEVEKRKLILQLNAEIYGKRNEYNRVKLSESNRDESVNRFFKWYDKEFQEYFKDYNPWGGTKTTLSEEYTVDSLVWEEKLLKFLADEKLLGYDKNIDFYDEAVKIYPITETDYFDKFDIIELELDTAIVN